METFVVRIWRPSPSYETDPDPIDPDRLPLRGVVRRIADGTELPFAGAGELIDLLSVASAHTTQDGATKPGRGRARG